METIKNESDLMSTKFSKFLSDSNRNPEIIKKYCKPYITKNGFEGFQVRMCNGGLRFNYFENGEKKIHGEKGGKLAPIILFDSNTIHKNNRIYFTEGESDAFCLAAFSSSVIAIPGANSTNCISNNILHVKERLPLDQYELCILFDNDTAGKTGALKLKEELLTCFPKSQVTIFDWTGVKAKDIREGIVEGELNFYKINLVLDHLPSFDQKVLLLDELESPAIGLKCPLDYSEDRGILYWTVSNKDRKIIFESNGIPSLTNADSAGLNFFDIENSNTLEFFDVSLLKDKISKNSWDDQRYFQDIFTTLKSYVSASDEALAICSGYIVLSYIFPVFKHIPYLYLSGVKGSGKSTLSELISLLSFNGEHLSCPSLASTRRIIHMTRGLISFDDVEFLASDSEETQEFRSQLNSGYETRATTSLCSGKNNIPERFYIGGPKVFNSIEGMESVLSSRSIYLKMKFDSSFRGDKVFYKTSSIVKEFRSRGILNALFNHTKIKNLSKTFDLNSSRDSDLLLPLLSIAAFFDSLSDKKDGYEKLISLGFEISKELKKERWSFDMCLVNALYDIWQKRGNLKDLFVFNGELKDELYCYSDDCVPKTDHHLKSKIGQTLKSIDLVSEEKRAIQSQSIKGTRYKIKTEILEALHKRNTSL